ncbi:hypothetical protein WSK_2941 [Novosphingobium sp. Rr 2-17]|uniref:KpsF/GutQ family sugar-phosphate isomerase n=1 Tax=Novosphingobium sp. Rr 2-17 TaxID=555793 RepID=UPI000269A219|nr:KpsF/GutQ family sugar-phosphate isomerase [Novosphingobium sp. Rr 2-17]EIZ78497.1 hypothetical protein WSK_2941 [Novosphingobium sp. Rr 2-17]
MSGKTQLSAEAFIESYSNGTVIIDRAREVIDLEARTLDNLANSLGSVFVRACRLLHDARGRIVVAGIGKSGHIARKIAATLSATGSPSFYLHPGEAAHGDLGMVVRGDVILAISNSGNTAELRVLLEYADAVGIPVVGVTSSHDSMVSRSAAVCVMLPPAQEACPVNIAPTSSTTQQLALGDAIAMVLMDMHGIGRDEIKTLHPGGEIGLRLASVSELMHGPDKLPLVSTDLPMDSVISQMTSMGFGIAGVIDDDGCLMGIITDGDLRRHFKVLGEVTALDVMSRNPKILRASMPAQEALQILNDAQITCAFVVADDEEPVCTVIDGDRLVVRRPTPIGIIHVHDFLRQGLS